MSTLLTLAMAAAAALFVGLSATMNALFLSSLGRTPLEAIILAALSIAGDMTKAVLPVVMMRAAQLRAWVHLAGASLLMLLVVILSLSSGMGFAALTRSGVTAARQTHADQLAALERALRDAQMRLALVAGARPASVVEADIAVVTLDRRWSVSKSCNEISGPSVRQFCADLFKLRSERVAALEHDRLTAERIIIENKLAARQSESIATESDPQAAAIASLLGIDVTMPRRALATFMAIVIELGSVISVLLVAGPALSGWREPGSVPAPAPVPDKLPPSRDVSHWHRHRGAFKLALNPGEPDAR